MLFNCILFILVLQIESRMLCMTSFILVSNPVLSFHITNIWNSGSNLAYQFMILDPKTILFSFPMAGKIVMFFIPLVYTEFLCIHISIWYLHVIYIIHDAKFSSTDLFTFYTAYFHGADSRHLMAISNKLFRSL